MAGTLLEYGSPRVMWEIRLLVNRDGFLSGSLTTVAAASLHVSLYVCGLFAMSTGVLSLIEIIESKSAIG